jgi:hypothetical protein
MEELVREYGARAALFEQKAHAILALDEGSPSRAVVLSTTYEQLAELNVQQADLLSQALRCVEHGLFRAAHVMAWAAFMDYLEEKLSSDGLKALRVAYPKWKGVDIAEMAESVPERQFVEATRTLGLCTKNQMQALVSLLQRRNECAHPSSYYPEMNETLGYISELIKRLKTLAPKTL